MKLREMYETAVRLGIQADPRGKQGVDRFLERTRERYEKLPDYLKQVFDGEELTNPFADTRIYVGDPEAEVSTILAGIDMNVGEVLLADRLREKGTQIDAIYTHHPEGWGLSRLDAVMSVQADIWAGAGVPIQAGERLIEERRKAVRLRLMPINHTQAIDAARLLGVPFWGLTRRPTTSSSSTSPRTSPSASPRPWTTCAGCCSICPSTASPPIRAPARRWWTARMGAAAAK